MIRRATAEDAPFLRQMLSVAADWRPGARLRPVAEVMADPELAHYVADWPRDGDRGFVAEDGAGAVGAAWWRLFPEHDRGFGFVDEATPELSIGVVHEARRRGIGTLLLRALIDEAERSNLTALSVSVEPDNPAASLYEHLGFKTVLHTADSVIMVRRLKD